MHSPPCAAQEMFKSIGNNLFKEGQVRKEGRHFAVYLSVHTEAFAKGRFTFSRSTENGPAFSQSSHVQPCSQEKYQPSWLRAPCSLSALSWPGLLACCRSLLSLPACSPLPPKVALKPMQHHKERRGLREERQWKRKQKAVSYVLPSRQDQLNSAGCGGLRSTKPRRMRTGEPWHQRDDATLSAPPAWHLFGLTMFSQ